jgi:hypothetical protein
MMAGERVAGTGRGGPLPSPGLDLIRGGLDAGVRDRVVSGTRANADLAESVAVRVVLMPVPMTRRLAMKMVLGLVAAESLMSRTSLLAPVLLIVKRGEEQGSVTIAAEDDGVGAGPQQDVDGAGRTWPRAFARRRRWNRSRESLAKTGVARE